MYLAEQKQGLNDKYKSQNCRQFYREKFCQYGKRCHFRHEYRTFQKIHRHHYQAHLAAINVTSNLILAEAKSAPEGTLSDDCKKLALTEGQHCSEESFETSKMGSVRTASSDISTDSVSQHCDNFLSIIPHGNRLSIFQSVTQMERETDDTAEVDPRLSPSFLKLINLEEGQSLRIDADNWSQSSVE